MTCGLSAFWNATGIETPTTVIDHPSATKVVKLEFGLRATEPGRWSGESAVSTGTIHSSWGWHFTRPDRIIGATGWEFEARRFNPEGVRYRFREELPGGAVILPNGVYVSVEGPPLRPSFRSGPTEATLNSSSLSFTTAVGWSSSAVTSPLSLPRQCER